MRQHNIIIIAAALLMTACVKDIDYKGPDGKRMLIVNSISESGRVPVFEMSHSSFFLDQYHTGNVLNDGIDISVTINGQEKNAHAQLGKFYIKRALENLKSKNLAQAVEDATVSYSYVANPQALQVAGQASQKLNKGAQAIKNFVIVFCRIVIMHNNSLSFFINCPF